MNPKVLFREYFTISNPDPSEEKDCLRTILPVNNHQVDYVFDALRGSEVQEVDDNLFTAVWLFLWHPEIDHIEKEFLRNAWRSS